ncbi:MAG TPA: ABC transporter permease [Candidatus Mediterraneibacter excrementipullorum]|nr:ABC transporter permease [Candidatus Mediterraneibacter excrementipullorum]
MKNKQKGINLFETARTLLAVGIAVVFTIVIIFLVSDQPLNAIYCFFVEPLLSFRYWSNIIELMTPLLFTGLAMTFILQTKVYNLAVEGMFYVGGMGAAMVAILLHMGSGVHAAIALLCGALAGVAVSVIPAALKLKFEANEIVSSLMLNYIVFYVGDYLLKTLIRDPNSTFVSSRRFDQTATLFEFSRGIHMGLVIAAVLIVLAYIFLFHTKWGYAIRMCGENKNFAKYSGIGVTSTILISQIIGGLIAGLGGAAYMLGSQQTINYGWRSGYGWDGIMIAIIARNNPKYVPIGAFLLAYLRTGADIMSRNTDVQNEVVSLIQGVIIILVAATGFLAKFKKKITVKMLKENEAVEGGQA